jgi:hypothetical protein
MFRCFLWLQERLCGAARSESPGGVRTLAIPIRYGLRLNHLRLYYITDREPTGRYPDKRLSACLAPTGFPRFQRLCSPANLPGLGNKDGSR